MITTIVLSVLVPTVVLAVAGTVLASGLAVRPDVRGVALQTVIVIVVLLAIAGAVAGVLIQRGGEAVAEAERQEIVRAASEFTHEGLCESYGFTWAERAKSCYRTVPDAPAPNAFSRSRNDCENAIHPQTGVRLGYTWTPNDVNVNPDTAGTCSS